MERRIFLQKSLVVGAGLAIRPNLLSYPMKPELMEKITILHTNDTHSNTAPFPSLQARDTTQRGLVRRYVMFEDDRRPEKSALPCDAGDVFQGTRYFNKFHVYLDMQQMLQMGYRRTTMGYLAG